MRSEARPHSRFMKKSIGDNMFLKEWGFDEGLQLFGNITREISYTASLNMDGEVGNGSGGFDSKGRGLRLAGDRQRRQGEAHGLAVGAQPAYRRPLRRDRHYVFLVHYVLVR